MPMMPRARGKATKICWEILGKPAAFNVKRTRQQAEINKQLIFSSTVRVR